MTNESSPTKKEIKISIPFNRQKVFRECSTDKDGDIELQKITHFFYDDVNKVAYI